jgi:hypothetical protein
VRRYRRADQAALAVLAVPEFATTRQRGAVFAITPLHDGLAAPGMTDYGKKLAHRPETAWNRAHWVAQTRRNFLSG